MIVAMLGLIIIFYIVGFIGLTLLSVVGMLIDWWPIWATITVVVIALRHINKGDN
ncbi:MAG: hypothetical protein ACRDDY_03300 [Clostridium sp.]|uniref:hypothetical protein n=1 Tax=Clostridium sp. TaxID=1506 RepID=UPI003EE81D66